MESPETGTDDVPVMGSIEPVSVAVAVTVAVSDSVRGPGSGVRSPVSGVRLLQRDQVNPVTVTVSDSVTVSVSVSVTGSDASRADPSHFHASTGGPWSMG